MQQTYAVFSARNRHSYLVVEFKHIVLGNRGSDFRFDGLGKAFFAEFLSRVKSMKESFSSFAGGANCGIWIHHVLICE